MFNKKKFFTITTFIAILATVSIAYAAHTTIDTNNGVVDANWSNVPVLQTDGDDIGNDNYDINQVWVANESDNSAFYFRASLIGSGQLPNDYSSFEARLDCDQNGNYLDSVDVIVYYAINGAVEELVECQGDEYDQCDYNPEPNNSDTNTALFGEEIAGPPYNYEWRAYPSDGTTDWSQCFGQINVQFASLNNGFVVQDSTVMRAYNVPTAIQLSGLTAANRGNQSLFAVGALGLFLGMIAILGIKLSRKRSTPT